VGSVGGGDTTCSEREIGDDATRSCLIRPGFVEFVTLPVEGTSSVSRVFRIELTSLIGLSILVSSSRNKRTSTS